MAGDKILVLGGTGPAGICLLRELVHRNHDFVVYARNPSKIPTDLASNPKLEVFRLNQFCCALVEVHVLTLSQVVRGEMTDTAALSTAVSKCNIVLSLLGPNKLWLSSSTEFPDYYRLLFPLMRQHGATRIYAMGTVSIYEPLDHFSLIRTLLVWLVYLVAHVAYRNIIGIGQVFEKEAEGIDWTVFRIGGIPGGSDAESWRLEREGEVAVGWVGKRGWRSVTRRSELARWLVDCAEGKEGEVWVKKKPAVSSRGS